MVAITPMFGLTRAPVCVFCTWFHVGETGLLVPPGDPGAIVDAVSRLLDNRELAGRLGCAARQRIHNRFSVDRMVRATEELYEDLLARKQQRKPVAA